MLEGTGEGVESMVDCIDAAVGLGTMSGLARGVQSGFSGLCLDLSSADISGGG